MRARHGLAVALLFAVTACGGKDAPTDNNGNTGPGGGGGGGGGSTSDDIEVLDNSFSPNATTLPTGSTVTWTWSGVNQHSVIFTTAGPTNSVAQSAGTFNQTFNAAGVYNYVCGVHGTAMSGKVTIVAP